MDDRHALYVGWVCGIAIRNGIEARPVNDEAGNHTDHLAICLPDGFGNHAMLEVVVPYPPDDWHLSAGQAEQQPDQGGKGDHSYLDEQGYYRRIRPHTADLPRDIDDNPGLVR